MIKSINQWAFSPDRALSEVFVMARDAGFDAVEVTIDEKGALTPDSSADECAQVVQAATDAGITLSGLASGFGWGFSDDLRRPKRAATRHRIEYRGTSRRQEFGH